MDVKTIKFESAPEYKHLESKPVAFFCSEYALDEDSPVYAGGLGVLAGDFILQASQDGVPFVALGLWYGGPLKKGGENKYSKIEEDGVPVVIEVMSGDEVIKAHIWARRFGKSVYLFLLDSNIDENSIEIKITSDSLYDSNAGTSMKQKALLGIGSVKVLTRLGIKPSIYHLNDGHTAFAGIEIIIRHMADNGIKDVGETAESIKEKIVATKHTIFSEAGPTISEEDFRALVGPYCQQNKVSVDDIYKLGESTYGGNIFSTTQFILSCAKRQNGVSVLHTEFEKLTHPNSILFPITNGVHVGRWQAKEWQSGLESGKVLMPGEIWKIKRNLRERLTNFVLEKTGVKLDPDACTIVWARRFTPYKRPELLFSDLERLKKICSNSANVQFIISGKAYLSNETSLGLINKIKAIILDPVLKNKIVYLDDYSVEVAKELVFGADVWLNTPEYGFEASGTSGMKAGLNGAIQLSISDGWIDEVDWSGKGFILPVEETGKALYEIIENKIVPLFYNRDNKNLPLEWIEYMRKTQETVESNFTAKRMLKDYLTKAYMVI